ncbi:MAG: hypothetical protein UX89_C0002G0053 [Parcubacteria group bacterium GW2011_GWA2_47_16]|nr:MAG: hypothetical protein UX89_C0002G0053 [Parcubacteria group bacterium GW2011_GWA2_47_16]
MKKVIRKKAPASSDRSEIDRILENIRETPLRKAEKGAAYVALAEIYLDTTNGVLDRYKKSLEDTIRDWNKLDRMGKAFDEKLSLAKIRASLNK